MEHAQETTGVSRGQNQLHVLHEDWQAASDAIRALLPRVEVATPSTQIVVVTRDSDAAAGIATRLGGDDAAGGARILAATSGRRAARVLRHSVAHVILGDAATLVALLSGTTLKVDAVKATVLAWVEEAGSDETAALEALMTEMPKDAARIVFASAVTPAVETLIERYARRARRVGASTTELPPVSLSFVSVSESGRLPALRRVLDAMDPPSAVVVVRDESARAAVRSQLRGLGYGADTDAVRVVDSPVAGGDLLVLYDLSGAEEQLRGLVAGRAGGQVVALVTPRQIASLRRIAGGTVTPLVLPEAAERARTREESLREELRRALETGQFSRELLAVEPLLAEFDGAEIAAAAIRILEAERLRAAQPALPVAAPKAVTRIYVNVGSMDNVRPGDLVGAITHEAGVSRAELGRVDVRERHSTVEVATPIANAVVARLTGVTIRGRRAIARVDEGPEHRERSDRPSRPRREPSGSRGRRER